MLLIIATFNDNFECLDDWIEHWNHDLNTFTCFKFDAVASHEAEHIDTWFKAQQVHWYYHTESIKKYLYVYRVCKKTLTIIISDQECTILKFCIMFFPPIYLYKPMFYKSYLAQSEVYIHICICKSKSFLIRTIFSLL